ncbi:MAG: DNA-protecting protein DprA [Candidatus Chisholmbacteria bacterium]|nr:DNA-protecting protein DprA [Candidatus Chisholmbacteria bacterium]
MASGIWQVRIGDEGYPYLLGQISSPPKVLYVKGELKREDSYALAVVGTRRPTSYGKMVAVELVRGLVRYGLTIVSGLARGIDGVAHRAALGAGGRTIAVLAHGLDRVYPPEHQALAETIVKQGALVSEYQVGTGISQEQFPARNRIIAGLSLGVLVVEGASRSGTKITARWAAEYGREVFAVPGPVGGAMSQGPAELIQTGAKLVTRVEDILEELPKKKPLVF